MNIIIDIGSQKPMIWFDKTPILRRYSRKTEILFVLAFLNRLPPPKVYLPHIRDIPYLLYGQHVDPYSEIGWRNSASDLRKKIGAQYFPFGYHGYALEQVHTFIRGPNHMAREYQYLVGWMAKSARLEHVFGKSKHVIDNLGSIHVAVSNLIPCLANHNRVT